MTALAPGQTVRMIWVGRLRGYRIATNGRSHPGLFLSERAAVKAFAFADAELATLAASKAGTLGSSITLDDLAKIRTKSAEA